MRGPGAWAIHLTFLAVNSVIVAGGSSMMSGRFYGLAMAASILAMVNIGACCCLPGLPVGIWSLIVLMRPEVKAAFY